MFMVLPFLSSLILWAANWFPSLGWLALVALIPLLFFFKIAISKKLASTKIIVFTWLSGLVYFLALFSWHLQIQTILGIQNVEPWLFQTIVLLTWLLAALLASLLYLFLGWFVTRMGKSFNSILITLVGVPAVWILGEYISSWLYSIVQWAPDATLGAHWNFGTIGLSVITTPLAQISRVTGLYGLGAVVVTINLVIYFLLSRQYRATWASVVIVCLFFFGQYAFRNKPQQELAVSAVQIGKNQQEQTANDPEVIELIQRSINSRPPDLVVMPEYPFLYEARTNQLVEKVFSSTRMPESSPIIYSTYGYTEENVRANHSTEIIYTNKHGLTLNVQKKYFLVPGGEYLPLYYGPMLGLLGQSKPDQQQNPLLYIKKPDMPESVYSNGSITFGALSCSGVMSPELYRRLANQSAQVLTNSAALESFTDAPGYLKKSKQLAMFHAIANDKPFIQAARVGRSYIIDNNGKTLAQTNQPSTAIIEARVGLSNSKTLYTRFGDVIVLIATAAVAWFFMIYKKQSWWWVK